MSFFQRLVRPFRTGVVTSRYPAEPPPIVPATRGLPTLDALRCTREAACVAVCPTAAIALGTADWTVDAGRCVFCGACARACPTGAISLDGGVLLAAATPAGLLHVTRLAMPPATDVHPESQ